MFYIIKRISIIIGDTFYSRIFGWSFYLDDDTYSAHSD